jgi:hypothetical protein
MIKYTLHFLRKLEDIFAESNYYLRYEKGTFKSGYCVLKDQQIIVVNNYYSLDGKINCLVEVLRKVNIDTSLMSDKNKEMLLELIKTS